MWLFCKIFSSVLCQQQYYQEYTNNKFYQNNTLTKTTSNDNSSGSFNSKCIKYCLNKNKADFAAALKQIHVHFCVCKTTHTRPYNGQLFMFFHNASLYCVNVIYNAFYCCNLLAVIFMQYKIRNKSMEQLFYFVQLNSLFFYTHTVRHLCNNTLSHTSVKIFIVNRKLISNAEYKFKHKIVAYI